MAYIPPDAKWWIADLVVEFSTEGEPQNRVQYKLTLLRADSADQAYSKALEYGRSNESVFINPEGKRVSARFRGLRDLFVIYDKLADGAELVADERVGVSEDEIVAGLRDRQHLSVFETWEVTEP